MTKIRTYKNASHLTDDVVLCHYCGGSLHDPENDIEWEEWGCKHYCTDMAISAPFDALKAAGDRCAQYLSSYGVEVEWSLGPSLLTLKAQYGADKVTKHLHYEDLRKSKDMDDLMKRTEQQALQGLSS